MRFQGHSHQELPKMGTTVFCGPKVHIEHDNTKHKFPMKFTASVGAEAAPMVKPVEFPGQHQVEQVRRLSHFTIPAVTVLIPSSLHRIQPRSSIAYGLKFARRYVAFYGT